jgi:hypothetical protein
MSNRRPEPSVGIPNDIAEKSKRQSREHSTKGETTYSSFTEWGFPICALKLLSRQKHKIHVRSRLCTSLSRARPSGVSCVGTVVFLCRFKSVAILSDIQSA